MACDALAADTAHLSLCNSKAKLLTDSLNLPKHSVEYDNLGLCVENFVELNQAKNHVLEYERENSCGLVCASKKKYAESFFDDGSYTKKLTKNIDEKDQEELKNHIGMSVKDFVAEEYNALLADENRKVDFGFPFIKKLIVDISNFTIEIQLKRLEDMSNDEKENLKSKFLLKIKDCLKAATTEAGIKSCVSIFAVNTTYKVGAHIQKELLDTHFSGRFSDRDYEDLSKNIRKHYDACAISYFYSSAGAGYKSNEKILPCVYNSIFEAFVDTAYRTIKAESDLREPEVKAVISKQIGACGKQNIIALSGEERYEVLQSYTEKEFTDYLLSCQESLTIGAVEEIGSQTIATHPSVVSIIGKEKAKGFAVSIIKEALPKCLKLLGKDADPKDCTNYIFSQTTDKLFPVVLDQKLNSFKSEFSFLTPELIEESKKNSLTTLQECHQKAQSDFKSYSSLGEKASEVLTAKCLRSSILKSLDKIIDEYIKMELSQNKVLIENGISFGFRRKQKIKDDFLSCSAFNIKSSGGLESVLKTSETFLDICILKTTKDVVFEVFDGLVVENLVGVGITRTQAEKIYSEYTKTDQNLLVQVQNATSNTEVEALLAGAKVSIISSLSQSVVKSLIVQKSPVDFSEKELEVLVASGVGSLRACLKTADLDICSAKAENKVVRQAVKVFFPKAVADEFKNTLKDSFSDEEIKSFKIKEKVLKGIKDTTLGRETLEFIVSEIDKGSSVEDLKSNQKVIRFITKSVFAPLADKLIGKLIAQKSPVKFSKEELASLVSVGKTTLLNCLESGSIEVCSTKAEGAVIKASASSFFPSAVFQEFNSVLKGSFSKKEIANLKINKNISNALSKTEAGKEFLNYITSQIQKGVSVEKLKKDPRLIKFVLNTAFLPIADKVLSRMISNKSPIKFSKEKLASLVSVGKRALLACLEGGSIEGCATKAEGAVIKASALSFFPSAASQEFNSVLKGSFSKKEIANLKINKNISNALSKTKAGKKFLNYITSQIQKGVSVEELKKDPRLIKFVLNTAFLPIADKVLSRMISNKSPIKFKDKQMAVLVATGKKALLTCFDKVRSFEKCATNAETAVMKKAVKFFVPGAVKSEIRSALKPWISSKKIDSFNIATTFSWYFKNTKSGRSVVSHIVSQIQKSVSVDKIKKQEKLTGFISRALLEMKVPGTKTPLLDEISALVIQKEIDSFIASAKNGGEGFFLSLGVKIRFAGKNKEALNWRKSRLTKSGKLATAKFKTIMADVIKTGRSITNKDKKEIEEHVTDAILSYGKRSSGVSKSKTNKRSKSKKKARKRPYMSNER